MRLDVARVRELACGRWPVIFGSLGIDVPHRRRGPCPKCGGKDRFRLDDQEGRGTWFCNQCDPKAGDGFDLVKNVRGCSFPQALSLVADVLGLAPSASIAPQKRPTPKSVSKVDRITVAFRFELGALDLRLRTDRILEAGKSLNLATLDDHELDQAIGLVAHAYADQDRAELFEGVADSLRERNYSERVNRERTTRVA